MDSLNNMEDKKIVEITGEGGIQCDNSDCDYTISVNVEDYKDWVNKPCPKCGENLLTQEDFDMNLKVFKTIEFINSLNQEQLNNIGEILEVNTSIKDEIVKVSFSVDKGIPNFKIIEE